jgi:hypothetical protein
VLLAERNQCGREHVMRNRHQTGNDELTAHLAIQGSHLLDLLGQLPQQALRGRNEFTAGVGLRHAACGADEQLHAETAFRLLDDAAKAGLRHVQVRRRRDEAAELRQRHYGAQMLGREIGDRVHRGIIPLMRNTHRLLLFTSN